MTQENAIKGTSKLLQTLCDDKDLCAVIKGAEKEKDIEFLNLALGEVISLCKELSDALKNPQ